MNSLKLTQDYLRLVRQHVPVIDVRAGVEFSEGHMPTAVSLPILNDDERAQVGTVYKKQGKEKAIELGHHLVQGENREMKLAAWIEFIKKNPSTIVTCFRGGLRSQTAQRWLAESGFELARLEGGYKAYRQWVLDQYQKFSERDVSSGGSSFTFRVISGTTGSGKTKLIEDLPKTVPSIDLERRANHRGSAFGGLGDQPSQSDFENQVWSDLLALFYDFDLKPTSLNSLVIEDESRLIGKRALPPGIFDRIRSSSIILIEEPLSARAQHILETYVLSAADVDSVLEQFLNSTRAISKKLGLERAQVIAEEIQKSRLILQTQSPGNIQQQLGIADKNFQSICLAWIEKLLVWYYDPMYLGSLERRQPKIEFRGTRKEALEYLQSCRFY